MISSVPFITDLFVGNNVIFCCYTYTAAPLCGFAEGSITAHCKSIRNVDTAGKNGYDHENGSNHCCMIFGGYRDVLTAEEKHFPELYRSETGREKYKVVCDFEKIVAEEIEKLAREKGVI